MIHKIVYVLMYLHLCCNSVVDKLMVIVICFTLLSYGWKHLIL